jgi:hypothetical protein
VWRRTDRSVPHPFAYFAKGWEQSIQFSGWVALITIRFATKGDLMLRIFAISSALLISSASLVAQAVNQYHPQRFDSQSQGKAIQVLQAPAGSSCPVAFSAKQGSGGGLVATRKPEPSQPQISQSIFLSLSDTHSAAVTGAHVTVHGLTLKSRLVLVGSGADGAAQISRPLSVSFSRDAMGNTGADLLLGGFTAVFSIDVDSITYADGSTWKSSEGLCRVIPDPMMLVSAR